MKPLKFLLAILLINLGGCASTPIVPDVEPAPLPMYIKTSPNIVMSYSHIVITCVLPRAVGDGAYKFGVPDYFTSGGPIDRLQISNKMDAPCEPFRVFCAYQEVGKNIVTIVKEITPVGECR